MRKMSFHSNPLTDKLAMKTNGFIQIYQSDTKSQKTS